MHRLPRLPWRRQAAVAMMNAAFCSTFSPCSHRYFSTPGKIKVNITVQDGTEFDFSTPTGISLREAIRDVAQLDMDVSCLKKMHCSICHVYVEGGFYEKLPPPTEEELDVLDKAFEPKDNSRLSCQVQLTPQEDGIVVVLPTRSVDLTLKEETNKRYR